MTELKLVTLFEPFISLNLFADKLPDLSSDSSLLLLSFPYKTIYFFPCSFKLTFDLSVASNLFFELYFRF